MSTSISLSPAFIRKRRFYVALPILIVPFVSLLFWSLGGGGGTSVAAQPSKTVGGLNLQLPMAKLKDESRLTKLDYYKKADADSAKRQTQIKNDPYYRLAGLKISMPDSASSLLLHRQKESKVGAFPASSFIQDVKSSSGQAKITDPNELKVYEHLAALNAQLNKATAVPVKSPPNLDGSAAMKSASSTALPPGSPDVDRLEKMMHTLHTRDTSADPEMRQLSGMLDKLIQIQHPAPLDESNKPISVSQKRAIYSIVEPEDNPISSLDPKTGRAEGDSSDLFPATRNTFYDLGDEEPANQGSNTFPAVVAETQNLVNGAAVKLQLLQSLMVNGVSLPPDQEIYGICQMSGDRLTITINSLRFGEHILPVSLSVYDLDGLVGIATPGAVSRDVAKQSADQSISSMGLASLDQSFGAQAATAGIQAAKNLLSKKVKLVQVTLPAGYQVLLKDNNQKSS